MSEKIKRAFKDFRWWLADRLSYAACKLRGHKWYLPNVSYPVPGNRANELSQMVWEKTITDHPELYADIEPIVAELAQMAGENWGHIEPCLTSPK